MQARRKQYKEEINNILQLIASNDYDNIVLAITLGKSLQFDIVQELLPILEMSKEAYPKTKAHRSLEESVILFLQLKKITLSLPPNCQYLDALIFCQNMDELSIDLKGQSCPSDFSQLHIKELYLKNCSTWPLSPEAIQALAQQKLQKLFISSSPIFENNQTFEVPSSLGKIKSLYGLDLEHAHLQTIPQDLLNLDKLELLTLHSQQEKLILPDAIFALPLLRFVYIDNIPENTFKDIGPKVKFKIRKPTFSMFWQLAVWKVNIQKYWEVDFNGRFLHVLVSTILFANILASFIFTKNLRSTKVYYTKASALILLSIPLFPIILFSISLIVYWKAAEWYQGHRHQSYTGDIILTLSRWATYHSGSIEGLGPMNLLTGIFLLLLFFLMDFVWPTLGKLLFLPLALVIATIGFFIEGPWRLLSKSSKN